MRLFYLKYILEEDNGSLLRKFFQLQVDEPTKGDWATKCFLDIKELNITESLEEITKMSKTKFSALVKSKIKLNALKYLKGKQKSKGSEICYEDIEMADYLLLENDNY